MKTRVPTRYFVALFGLQFLGFAIVAAAAVRFWLAPWQPLAAFALFGVCPMLFWAFIGALMFDPTASRDGLVRGEAPPVEVRMRLSVVPVLVLGVLFGAILALWFSPAARAVALDVAAMQRMAPTLESAMSDSDAGVRLTACEGLRAIGSEASSMALVGRLGDESPDVVDCALEAMSTGSADEVPHHVRLATGTWFRELMQEAVEPERACRLSNRLRVAERVGDPSTPVLLLECSLAAPDGRTRECCAQSFRASLGADGEPAMILPHVSELARTDFVEYIPALLEATFGDSVESEQLRQSLRLDGDRTLVWTLAAGCAALESSGAKHRGPVSAAMARVISSEACQIAPATERTVRLWTAACSDVVSPDEATRAAGDEPARLCHGIEFAIATDAVNEARQHVRGALRDAWEPHRRARMMRRLLDYTHAVDTSEPEKAEGSVALGTRDRPMGGAGLMRHLFGHSDGMSPSDDGDRPDDRVLRLMETYIRHGGPQRDDRE